MWNQGVVIESISKSILTAPWKCFRWGKASRRAAFRPGRVGQSAPELFIRSYTVKANHASKAARFPNTIQGGQTTCVKDFWSLSWFSCVVLVFAGTRYMFLPEISWGAVILFLLILPLYKLFNPERQKNALNFLCKKKWTCHPSLHLQPQLLITFAANGRIWRGETTHGGCQPAVRQVAGQGRGQEAHGEGATVPPKAAVSGRFCQPQPKGSRKKTKWKGSFKF